MTIRPAGRLDITTADRFAATLDEFFAGEPCDLSLDLEDLIYISSIGLRLILTAWKRSHAAGTSMTLRNLRPEVKNVFDLAGFTDFLRIE